MHGANANVSLWSSEQFNGQMSTSVTQNGNKRKMLNVFLFFVCFLEKKILKLTCVFGFSSPAQCFAEPTFPVNISTAV